MQQTAKKVGRSRLAKRVVKSGSLNSRYIFRLKRRSVFSVINLYQGKNTIPCHIVHIMKMNSLFNNVDVCLQKLRRCSWRMVVFSFVIFSFAIPTNTTITQKIIASHPIVGGTEIVQISDGSTPQTEANFEVCFFSSHCSVNAILGPENIFFSLTEKQSPISNGLQEPSWASRTPSPPPKFS